MTRMIGAQLALLAFSGAIVAGLAAGNTPTTILWRALLALAGGMVVGQTAGWAGKLILRDHLQRQKRALDREHLQSRAPDVEPDAVAGDAQSSPASAKGIEA